MTIYSIKCLAPDIEMMLLITLYFRHINVQKLNFNSLKGTMKRLSRKFAIRPGFTYKKLIKTPQPKL